MEISELCTVLIFASVKFRTGQILIKKEVRIHPE